MATAVHYTRTQWAGGQGFFHSGDVQVGDRRVLYVYDCGALAPGQLTGRIPDSLTREIAVFRERHGDEIDLLFVSHYHADHINGLPSLLQGAHLETAVIPLVPIAERLLVFAQALATALEITDWYRDVIADPASAIRDIADGVEIIGVEPSLADPDEDPTEGQFDPPVPEDPPPGTASEDLSNDVELRPGTRSVLEGSDGHTTVPLWEWDTMATTFALRKKDAFLDALAKELGISRAALDTQLDDPTGVRDLVTQHEQELEAAYSKTYPDVNLTSLLVYSGPATEVRSRGRTHRTRPVVERGELCAWGIHPGWLGTGDQSMGVTRCQEAVKHFGARLARVGSLALPHHGSDSDCHPSLLAAFGDHRPVCSASVGTYNTYGHPGRKVLMEVSSNGNHVVVVTEREASRWTEAGVSYL
ncbi:MBL fold metallo-hydrolase [Ornithinimicrobium ciconiae]|uniref:MBL fold metallo-hydrolase n=1 Tax=Ornithinimicrobium ciconiae TaxID=2594265 RepID=A0A516GDA5_9MICO|nr:MBL fold metallo-hydrolase [Ornithinimicrobium ciconiae]QDO89499.1 MBL fold metallo-hydrolase [Ornithinimicrobium ciconiae]